MLGGPLKLIPMERIEMQDWEVALQKFLKRYDKKPFFEGAVLCGSYASGNQNAFSDIDINVLISDTQNWRERGNVIIDGFLIEYFINPIKRIRKEFQLDVQRGRTTCADMFVYGRIIADKKGLVGALQKEGALFLKKPIPKYKRSDLALDFYIAWNALDELHSLAREKKSLGLAYNYLLEGLINLYFKAKRIPKLPLTKLEKIFTNSGYASKYHVQKLPDKKFITLFLKALQVQQVQNVQKLYDYVMDQLGGFDIAHFKIHDDLKT